MKLETAGDRGEMSPPAVLLVLDTARRVCDMQERDMQAASKRTGRIKCSNQTVFVHSFFQIIAISSEIWIYFILTRSFHSLAHSRLTMIRNSFNFKLKYTVNLVFETMI